MKKLLKTALLIIIFVIPVSVRAEVDVKINVNFPLPPHILFSAPPVVVVIPETNVYVAPDVKEDVFFTDGWWWRPWEGRWYRSRYYDRGWAHYNGNPSFYRQVPADWRRSYREHRWKGYKWDHRAVPYHDAEKNWNNWKKNQHWKKENYWGVRGMEMTAPSQKKKYHGGGSKNYPGGSARGYGKGYEQDHGKKGRNR